MNRLDIARRDFEWELGDLCVERYRGVVRAVMDSLPSSSIESNSACGTDPNTGDYLNDRILSFDGAGLETTLPPDIDLQMEWFDERWESSWLDGFYPSSN